MNPDVETTRQRVREYFETIVGDIREGALPAGTTDIELAATLLENAEPIMIPIEQFGVPSELTSSSHMELPKNLKEQAIAALREFSRTSVRRGSSLILRDTQIAMGVHIALKCGLKKTRNKSRDPDSWSACRLVAEELALIRVHLSEAGVERVIERTGWRDKL